ncbi:MAG: alpha/beta hydrolase [Erysipelotrichaceae bacterium]|nr:alpha/beta hydrolase [Erysipelotrichaceae bacterium]
MNPKEQMELLFQQAKERRKQYDHSDMAGKELMISGYTENDIQVFVHHPRQKCSESLPVYINLHGGAWLAGDAVCMDTYCQKLADEIPALVINLNYTKIDEKPFPYARDELTGTVRYFIENAERYGGDPKRILTGGFSAGGQIAAAAALKLAQTDIRIQGNVLAYPVVNFDGGDVKELQFLNLFARVLFADGENRESWMSPLMASDEQLKNLCPTVIAVCGKDPLSSDAVLYAQKLIRNGVEVCFRRFEGALHGFIEENQPGYSEGKPTQTEEQKEYSRSAVSYIIHSIQMLCAQEQGDAI